MLCNMSKYVIDKHDCSDILSEPLSYILERGPLNMQYSNVDSQHVKVDVENVQNVYLLLVANMLYHVEIL